ncbi:ion transporter [Leptolyngbya sp. Heron Island J]|uniref:ion transporter n=1 Tax=Leptolyngbya sp. Heron Island J TaxID=1385935 RepID=UPI0003B9C6F1|nr:ion transporter [Leptolyngbya sp. Heron Island J]ESA38084.1 ion transporter [Leptolyngbya sp. Heron Island J]
MGDPVATLKLRIRAELEEAETSLGLGVNIAIAALILISAGLFIAETYSLSANVSAGLAILDWLILILFLVEYGVRLWAAEHPLRYAISPYAIVDLVAILPVLVGFFDTRLLRLIRWLRVLKLARFLEEEHWLGREGLIIARIIFTLVSIIFIYSGAIFQVEHPVHPEVFGTFLDAMYFAVVTMTTVGYGDVTPVSEAGRTLTIMMILTGIALIPTQVGSLIQNINRMQNVNTLRCIQCGLSRHENDAIYCRRCGTRLPEVQETSKA